MITKTPTIKDRHATTKTLHNTLMLQGFIDSAIYQKIGDNTHPAQLDQNMNTFIKKSINARIVIN